MWAHAQHHTHEARCTAKARESSCDATRHRTRGSAKLPNATNFANLLLSLLHTDHTRIPRRDSAFSTCKASHKQRDDGCADAETCA
mmetsp:Transcript_10971/g.40596  ORF Transcript_10971/g.40596 Transcript_10971/m.40596 type:complete len:86 (-) Transcript_10971:3763-4020(-)